MAQSTILAIGSSPADSTTVVIGGGITATVGIFNNAELSDLDAANVVMVTPSAPVIIARLDALNPATVINGPGSFVVKRIRGSHGAFLEQ